MWKGEQGGWWRIIVTISLAAVGVLIGGVLVLAIFSTGLNHWGRHQPLYMQQIVPRLFTIVTSSLGLAGVWIGVRFVHRKSMACIFTDGRPFGFSLAFQSAALWLVLWFASACLFTGKWERISQRAHEIPLVVLAALVIAMFCATSVQGAFEEVVFRGYLQSRIGAWVKRPWIAVAVVGALFASLHLDSSGTGSGMAFVLTFGLALGIGAVRAGSLAPLCGIHAANNAMEFLWFPKATNAELTWSETGVAAAALVVWLVWLFWITRCPPNINMPKPSPN